MDVALFITCLTDTFAPRVGVAMVRVLRHFGCTVQFPTAQTCCGQPAYNNGFHDDAAHIARQWLRVFEPYEVIVTPSGSCAHMVQHHIPELFEHDPAWATAAHKLASRTYEFTQFLTGVLNVDYSAIRANTAGPCTFHYSCHNRGLQTPEEASLPLRQMQNLDYRPLPNIDQCCGFGGAFGALYPDISNAMTTEKLDDIAGTGAATVVCNEAGCTTTIAGLAHRRSMPVRFVHIAELLAESLGLMEDQP